MNVWITAGGYVLSFLLGALLLKAHQDIGQAIGDCNADKAEAIAQAEQITRRVEREAADRALAQQQEWAERSMNAIQGAYEAERAAIQASAQTERDVFQTTLERFDEDIPDSGACLSVYVLDRDVAGMRDN